MQSDECRVLRRAKSLWIHGAGLSGQTWQPLTADLPQSVTPDLPGHGTAHAALPPTVESFAERLLPLLKDDMVLVGHSLGGMVALELAVRSPVRLRGLILIEAVSTVRDRWIGRVGPPVARPVLKYLPRSLLERMAGAGQSRPAIKETRRWLSRMKRDQIVAAFDAARFYDGRRHLAKVTTPTLVIVGTENTATHRGARLIANSLKGAEFETLDGGHMLHIDNPDGLRRTIETFLARTRSGTRSNEKHKK